MKAVLSGTKSFIVPKLALLSPQIGGSYTTELGTADAVLDYVASLCPEDLSAISPSQRTERREPTQIFAAGIGSMDLRYGEGRFPLSSPGTPFPPPMAERVSSSAALPEMTRREISYTEQPPGHYLQGHWKTRYLSSWQANQRGRFLFGGLGHVGQYGLEDHGTTGGHYSGSTTKPIRAHSAFLQVSVFLSSEQ